MMQLRFGTLVARLESCLPRLAMCRCNHFPAKNHLKADSRLPLCSLGFPAEWIRRHGLKHDDYDGHTYREHFTNGVRACQV
jgi:hypothetical protein